MTVRDMLRGALRLLRAYGTAEDPPDDELTDALEVWNELINNWNSQHLTVYTIVNRPLPLTGSLGTYTMGQGGAFNYPRPVKIESAGIIQANGLRLPLHICTSQEWAAIPEKSASGRQPLELYNNNDYPLCLLSLWPVPKQNCTLDLYVWEELSDTMQLDDPLDLPPPYFKALRYNLAIALAAEYGQEPPATVAKIAQESKNELFGLNASNASATEDPPAAPAAG